MRLLVHQRIFAIGDTFDVYDEYENVKYYVDEQILSINHKLRLFTPDKQRIGSITRKLVSIMPQFDIKINGRHIGRIRKEFSPLKPRYKVDFMNWKVQGNFIEMNFDVIEDGRVVAQIYVDPLHWSDYYVIDFVRPEDELAVLMLVLAIDMANRPSDDD